MENKRIVIAAGTSFIGKSLAACFGKHNDIIILTRQARPAIGRISYIQWDGKNPGAWCEALENADLLINLTGKSVNCRYNTTNKRIIVESRINATRALGTAVQTLKNPPAVWINASSATIYRHAEDRPMNEFNGEIANDFSVQVCKQWEQAFNDIMLPRTRKIILRIGITLGWENGGVMQPYLRLVKFGLGGYQGRGRQMYTWIHITDVCRMMAWLYENDHSEGVYNCTAPFPVTNQTFMKTLREAASHPFGLPAPTPLLKIGAALIGTETELLLKSRWVLPSRALQEGFVFAFPAVKAACEDILAHLPRSAYHLYLNTYISCMDTNNDKKFTVVLGASPNPERYSNMAVNRLTAKGHPVVAIGNRAAQIGDIPVITAHPALEQVDTVTLYLNPVIQREYYDYILQLHPKRIIFNPGAENQELADIAREHQIEPVEACTLVLLSTGQF